MMRLQAQTMTSAESKMPSKVASDTADRARSSGRNAICDPRKHRHRIAHGIGYQRREVPGNGSVATSQTASSAGSRGAGEQQQRPRRKSHRLRSRVIASGTTASPKAWSMKRCCVRYGMHTQ